MPGGKSTASVFSDTSVYLEGSSQGLPPPGTVDNGLVSDIPGFKAGHVSKAL